MINYAQNLATYSPTKYVDYKLEDPFVTADLNDGSDIIFEQPIIKAEDILSKLKSAAADIKSRQLDSIPKQPASITDISFPELLRREGINAKITSGYRPGAKTNTGKKSNHSIKGGAYDIVPTDGKTFEDLRKEIYSNKNIRDWMNAKGWGIIEEVSDSDKKKYGATGANWHFGPDQAALVNWRKNLIRYGANGFKFEDTLASNENTYNININPDSIWEYRDSILNQPDTDIDLNQNIDEIDDSTSDDVSDLLDLNDLDVPSLLDSYNKEDQFYKNNKSSYTGTVPQLIRSMVPDSSKADILTKIAHNESGFRINAKNPKSSASGLFGFINSTKQRFGYGSTAQQQIQGASRYYDYLANLVQPYINKYGTKGLSKGQIMYGLWFRPQSMLNYLKSGQDAYADAQGTSLHKILNKMT